MALYYLMTLTFNCFLFNYSSLHCLYALSFVVCHSLTHLNSYFYVLVGYRPFSFSHRRIIISFLTINRHLLCLAFLSFPLPTNHRLLIIIPPRFLHHSTLCLFKYSFSSCWAVFIYYPNLFQLSYWHVLIIKIKWSR